MRFVIRPWSFTVGMLSAFVLSRAASGQTPQLINYQGRLLDGTNLVNGSVGLSLRLFDAASGGTKLYEDSNTVAVADGLYSTLIGDNTTFGNLQAALENSNVWVEVAVDDAALSPRERLVAAAYAVKSRATEIFTGAVGDGQISTNVARLNGTNQTFSGTVNFSSTSNTFTGTFSGNGEAITNLDADVLIVKQPVVVGWGQNNNGQAVAPAGLTSVVAIAAGFYHSLALLPDGTVMAWGRNDKGQTNVPATATGVVAIAAGENHNLVLRSDGRVIAWGSSIATAVPVAATGVVAIAGGAFHSIAARSDGAVVAWGDNSYGQTAVPATATGVVAVASGYAHSLALRSDGNVVAWGAGTTTSGNPHHGQSIVPAAATGVVAIAAGSYHSLALRSDGVIVAWGYNNAGQTNVPTNATGVVEIKAGLYNSLALRSDGSVMVWGNNTYGQTNLPVGLTGVVAIAAGGNHCLALRPDRAEAHMVFMNRDNTFTGDNSFTGNTSFMGSNSLAGTTVLSGTISLTGTTTVIGTFLGSPPYIKVAETQPSGTDAGGNNATTNNFRNLNNELADTHNLANLFGGNVALQPGTYQCRISAPAYRVDEHQIRLRVVNGATLLYGTSEFSDDTLSPGVQSRSQIDGQFTLAATTTLTVQHSTALVKTLNGLGLAASAAWTDSAPYEVYTVAEFWKIK